MATLICVTHAEKYFLVCDKVYGLCKFQLSKTITLIPWCYRCVCWSHAGFKLSGCDGRLQLYPKIRQVACEEVASSCQGGLASACRLSLCRLLSPILHGQIHDSPVIEGLLAHARAIVPHTDEPLAGPARAASHKRNFDGSWLNKANHVACGSQGVVDQLSQGICKGVMTLKASKESCWHVVVCMTVCVTEKQYTVSCETSA